jgi:UDP-N-acetylmuramyl tripeptide synthase
MGRLRYGAAFIAAKLSIIALKVTGHNGTNFPGVVARKICPDFEKYIQKPETIIGITGTNGKTTCSNMLRDMLGYFGKDVLNNSAGSNTITGIVTSLIRGVTAFGRCKYDTAVFEMDERSSRLLFPYVQPDYLLITNLSRDSIMRNGHPEFIGSILERYMPEKTKLILNADDLLSAFISRENSRVYYGIEALPGDKKECTNLIDDMQLCPNCRSRLKYEYNRYSNIGRAYCPECGFSSPDYDCCARDVDLDKMEMTFDDGTEEMKFRLMGQGIFNIYNEVSVITLLRQLGYPLDRIRDAVDKIGITKSRFDEKVIGGITFRMMLCKDRNAYAVSRVFEYIESQPGDKEILFYCNNFEDAHNWSENTCWLYDCDFELIAEDRVKKIITCGDRGMDYKLRMMIAGIPEDRIVYSPDAVEGVGSLELNDGETLYLLYGTDSLSPAPAVKKKVIEVLSEREEKKTC